MMQVSVVQSLENLRSVLVVLIPVGSISNEKFVKYAQHVSSCTSFVLQEYVEFSSSSSHGSAVAGGFENRNWNRDVIHTRYEIQHVYSEWEELFLYQKPFAVVGIADCSVESDLTATFNLFSSLTSRYRISPSTSLMQQGVVPRTCLAFELRKDQKDPDLGTFKVIPDQDFEHFNFYITHIFGEELVRAWLPQWENTVKTDPEIIADKIFDSLYGPSENVSNPSTSHTALISLLDSDLPDEAPKGRKRRFVGRIRKQQGDLCLFAGSPIDAIKHFQMATEISRSCSDWEWVGSALESMAAAILSLRETTGDRLSMLDITEITSKLTEAKTCYERRRRSHYLEAENLLRTANFHQKNGRLLDMSELLSKCHDAIEALESSNFQGRIRLYGTLATIYRNANYTRKYAFYIRLICLLCLANPDIPAARAHQLLEQVAPEYDIAANSLLPPASAKSAKTRRAQLIEAGSSWSKLQASILSLLIDLSSSSGDTTQSVKYLVYLMREVAPVLLNSAHLEPSIFAPNRTDWGLKLKQFSMYMPPPLDTAPGDPLRLGMGILKQWRPLKDGAMYMHISRSVSDPLFLYRPNRKAKEAIAASANHVFVWPGHNIYFEVSLKNSLYQKTMLEDMRISFTPIVLTSTETRPGETRTEIDWLPPIAVDASSSQIQSSAQVLMEGGDTMTVKLSAAIPNLCNLSPLSSPSPSASPSISSDGGAGGTSIVHVGASATDYLAHILKDPRCKILLVPEYLHYSMFNCPFSEQMVKKFNTPVRTLLLSCLHFVSSVPTVSAEDTSHPWISYTTAIRDAEPVIAVTGRSSNLQRSQQQTPAVTDSKTIASVSTSSQDKMNLQQRQHNDHQQQSNQMQNGKCIHHLNIATSQLRGEKLSTVLVLKNESTHDVDDFGMTIQENGEIITASKPSQVLVCNVQQLLYDRIRQSLPLKPNQQVELPLEFVAPGLGLVQVSFLMEYRNRASADNMWRKLRMDYSFKVVEALKPLKIDVLQCAESSLEVLDRAMPHRVMVVTDERELTLSALHESDDEENYFLVQVAIQNKTMVSFHVAKDDQIESEGDGTMENHHTVFVVDPWGTKQFCFAFHRQSFVKRMHTMVLEGKASSYETACKDFLLQHLKLSWRSYGNRTGAILVDASLIDQSVLSKLKPQRMFTKMSLIDMKGATIKASSVPDSPLPTMVIQANQIYKLNAVVHFLNERQHQAHTDGTSAGNSTAVGQNGASSSSTTPTSPDITYFSAVCHTHHLNNHAQNVSWIGKYQNIALSSSPSKTGERHGVQIPILFHNPGIYSISARVHDAHTESDDDFWSRELSVLVTR